MSFLIPSKSQWNKWSLPSKCGFTSFYLAIISIALTIAFFFWPTSPATPVTVIGSNNAAPVIGIANSPGAKVNVGLSDDAIELIRKGMEAKEKENEAALKNLFPGGYAIFTATKGEQIIPLDRIADQNLFETYWTNSSVKYTPESIIIMSPNMVFSTKHIQKLSIGSLEWTVPRNVAIGTSWRLVQLPEGKLGMLIIGTNEDSLTIAIGIDTAH